MKSTNPIVLLLTIVLATLPFQSYSQENILDKTISISFENETLKSVIKKIEQQTGVSFAYSKLSDLNKKVSGNFVAQKLSVALDALFKDTNISYKEIAGKITLFESKKPQSKAERVTIHGYITDAKSGERLINANVYNPDNYLGTISNNYGFYSYSAQTGKMQLSVNYMGYQTQTFHFGLENDTTLNISLQVKSDELKEVTVLGSQSNQVENTQMSMNDIPIQKLNKIPVILGEADVLKVLQLLPGVQAGVEGTSGIYVRGGGPDQNLFLLDGVPVYNPTHLLGFFSTFNPDAINTVKLYKGGFPARFGGRLSSVVDITMKDGNKNKLKGNVSVGLISSKLELDGPLFSDKTTFMLSARRTYMDVLVQPFLFFSNKAESHYKTKAGGDFHDYNLKIKHSFSAKSQIYVSAYSGKDGLSITDNWDYHYQQKAINSQDETEVAWGNNIASFRWNYLFSSKLFSNTTLTYSKYNFDVNLRYLSEATDANWIEDEQFNYHSGIEDYSAKIDFDYYPHPNHAVKFGTAYIRHHFSPGVTHLKYDFTDYAEQNSDSTWGNRHVYANECASYLEDEISLSARLKLNAGLHLSLFNVDEQNYWRLQPRFSLWYKLTSDVALKASYSRMAQHLHLLSNSGISLPTDIWVPVTKNFKPPLSDQLAVGTAINLPKGFNLTLEGFYKKME
ncbi:MAG: TonB-dependent receptor domain-containing protein [Prolixibacteraceae bacterium]